LALYDFELNGIALLQAFIALGGNGAVVNEHVWPVVPSNKTVTFRVVEPLHGTFQTIHVRPLEGALNKSHSQNFAAIVRPAGGSVKTEKEVYSQKK
jgi:hypothetical protein